MTTLHSPYSQACEQIRRNPKFQNLARLRSKLAWTLTGVVLTAYYTFIMLVIFLPDWLFQPLYEGSHLSRGIPIGAAMIFFSWLLTVCYVQVANTRFDALSAEVLKEVRP